MVSSTVVGSLLAAMLVSVAHGVAVLEPNDGSWFGVSIDFSTSSVSQYLSSSGVQPVIWNVFVSLPLNGTTTSYLQQTLPQIAAAQAICLLTVEPDQGLDLVTADAVQQLASYISTYEQAGASFMIRYAHEMNGNWYPWGQQPIEYLASHKLVTTILRNSTCGVAMVWAPNGAEGYPWASAYADNTALSPQPQPGSADFKLLDTNGDGQLTSADDPYGPYYPGDAYVDWVGTSSFHFGGTSYPYTENQQAAPFAFTNGFTGNASSPPVPNFYGTYCNDGVHNKPMVITETSAMYNPSNPSGQTDFTIKSNWWQQVFNVQGDNSQALDMSVHFPKVKAIMWFDEIKVEAQAAGATIDWRFTGNQQIQSGLGIYLQTPAVNSGAVYWKQLDTFKSSASGIKCSSTTPAASIPKGTSSSSAPPVTATTATFSSAVPVSSPPPSSPPPVPSPPPPQTTASSQQSTTSTSTQSFASTVASLIGRRLLA